MEDFSNSQINLFEKIAEKFTTEKSRKEFFMSKKPMLEEFIKHRELINAHSLENFPSSDQIRKDFELLKKLIQYIPNLHG